VGDNHLSLNKYKNQSISVTFNKSLLRNSISPSEKLDNPTFRELALALRDAREVATAS
jgi:hypothetical protein